MLRPARDPAPSGLGFPPSGSWQGPETFTRAMGHRRSRLLPLATEQQRPGPREGRSSPGTPHLPGSPGGSRTKAARPPPSPRSRGEPPSARRRAAPLPPQRGPAGRQPPRRARPPPAPSQPQQPVAVSDRRRQPTKERLVAVWRRLRRYKGGHALRLRAGEYVSEGERRVAARPVRSSLSAAGTAVGSGA